MSSFEARRAHVEWHLMTHLKQMLGSVLFKTPGLRRLAWTLLLRRKLRAGAEFSSLLTSAGHALDHSLSRGLRPSGATTARMEALLAQVRHSKVPLTDRDIWAIGLLGITRHQLAGNYRAGVTLESGAGETAPAGTGQARTSDAANSIESRRSVRQWRADPIPAELVSQVVTAATWAPCSCNRQSWKVLVLQKQEDKDFMKQFYPSAHNHFWASAPAVLVILMSSSAYNKADAHYAYLDAGAFIQNLLLATHSCGLGACWIGFMAWDALGNKRVSASEREAFHARFACPSDLVPVSLVPIGYPGRIPAAPPRRPAEKVILPAP
jgi:nitroreductase